MFEKEDQLSATEGFPNLLLDKLWHTTSSIRYKMIIDSGWILPNPPIPEKERWGVSQGPDFYPYVRSIGGVSLFDFEAFDPDNYSEKYPLSSWREFVPYRRTWGHSIWIEINRDLIAEAFIDGQMLLDKWKHEKAYKHNIMPIIEAAHNGPIALGAINSVYKFGKDIDGFETL